MMVMMIVLTDGTGAWFVRHVRGRITACSAHLPSGTTRHQRLRPELPRQHLPTPGLSSTSCRTTLSTSHPYWQVHSPHHSCEVHKLYELHFWLELYVYCNWNKIKFMKFKNEENVALWGVNEEIGWPSTSYTPKSATDCMVSATVKNSTATKCI